MIENEDNKFTTELWSTENSEQAKSFLRERYATSMFLLSNLQDLGFSLNDSPNSGNFKVIKLGTEIVAVFSLTRRGNLILSGRSDLNFYEEILTSCWSEAIKIKAVVGDWELSSKMWVHLQKKQILTTCSLNSKEVLYKLEHLTPMPQNSQVRLLTDEDFSLWLPLRNAYNSELKITNRLSAEDEKKLFLRYSIMKEHWGYFADGRLIAIASLNAVAENVGQVGGVYTVPEYRKLGYSKKLMRQLLSDCVSIHHLNKMILFTEENNTPAQKVYENLGFERIGHFGIFLA